MSRKRPPTNPSYSEAWQVTHSCHLRLALLYRPNTMTTLHLSSAEAQGQDHLEASRLLGLTASHQTCSTSTFPPTSSQTPVGTAVSLWRHLVATFQHLENIYIKGLTWVYHSDHFKTTCFLFHVSSLNTKLLLRSFWAAAANSGFFLVK